MEISVSDILPKFRFILSPEFLSRAPGDLKSFRFGVLVRSALSALHLSVGLVKIVLTGSSGVGVPAVVSESRAGCFSTGAAVGTGEGWWGEDSWRRLSTAVGTGEGWWGEDS